VNKEEFISLIEKPDGLGKHNFGSLKKIVADFPYFQCAQLLLTKALYNEQHYEFEKQLAYTSIAVPDRAILFRYLHNLEANNHISLATTHFVSENNVSENTIEEIVLPLIDETTIAIQSVDKPIDNSINATIIEEVGTENISVDESAQNEVEENTQTPNINETLAPTNTKVEGEALSFLDWLNLQQAPKATVLDSPIEPPNTTETPIITEVVKETEQNLKAEIAKQVERSNVNEFENILDKFIKENPRMSRPKAEFYNPVNMAKQSVEEDEELVTETLANVYYKQGHHKKAIRAYEKLCLLYPHKMPYFASLIQKIKTENKD
jgi:tetratricopeptide (TPR) repeat protein